MRLCILPLNVKEYSSFDVILQYVKYNIFGGESQAVLGFFQASFSNTASGPNKCSAFTYASGYVAFCDISSGFSAQANIYVTKAGHAPHGTSSTFTAAQSTNGHRPILDREWSIG